MTTTETSIPAWWVIGDPSTWSLTMAADIITGRHPDGRLIHGDITDYTLRVRDFDNGETVGTKDEAEWWVAILTAKLDADVALLEASPESVEQIADLIDERNDADDFEAEAAVCRRIVTALRG